MSRLENFGAYQKARQLVDLVVEDMAELRKDPRCYRLIAQQVASADSICANMDEGYGRLSQNEYLRFLDFSRGSARETQGRYQRLTHWLNEATVQNRVALADETIGILTRTIETLRRDLRTSGGTSYLRDEPVGPEHQPPDPLDPRPSTLDP